MASHERASRTFPGTFDTAAPRLSLAAAGEAQRLPFLDARLAYPDVTARALRTVSNMAAARYYIPPAMLARILREADPVATVSADAIRFESLSSCCSAYCRLDLDDDALVATAGRTIGTTNVDFGPAMKAALAKVRSDSALDLHIGAEGVAIRHERAEASEDKIALPLRWISGFAQVQQHMAGMSQRFSLSRVAALKFLRSLPRSKDDRLIWVSRTGQGLTISGGRKSGSVPLKGAHRLAGLEALCLSASGMEVFHNEEIGSSAWTLALPGQRLTITLNAEPWRGFSGDGLILSALLRDSRRADALVRAQLNWQSRLDLPALERATGLNVGELRVALARLSAVGLLGYDLHRQSWFHRVLPFDLSRLEHLNPRLRAAAQLASSGAVSVGPDGTSAKVASGGVVHSVSLAEGDNRCTCPWFAKNGTVRGPCKHVLAAEIATQGSLDA